MIKYYTPKIEEFYVGFLYEYKLNSGKWKSATFEPNNIGFVHKFTEEGYFTEEGNTRVKYLDREDIESLGLKLWQIPGDSFEYEFYIEDKDGSSLGTVIFNEDGTVDELEFFSTIFKIKNKSELKKLLTQLNLL